MRQLTLTNNQFDVLFDILQDAVDCIEGISRVLFFAWISDYT